MRCRDHTPPYPPVAHVPPLPKPHHNICRKPTTADVVHRRWIGCVRAGYGIGMTSVSIEDAVAAGPFSGVTLVALAGGLRDGTVDPVELVGRVIAAVNDAQPAINAFVSV